LTDIAEDPNQRDEEGKKAFEKSIRTIDKSREKQTIMSHRSKNHNIQTRRNQNHPRRKEINKIVMSSTAVKKAIKSTAAKCPYLHPGNGTTNKDWWPEAISLKILNQHNDRTDPMPSSFNYSAEFEKLDLTALKSDLTKLMTDSQDFWPADYGHYGPFFVRMACKYDTKLLFQFLYCFIRR
jgi:hypothetical protein